MGKTSSKSRGRGSAIQSGRPVVTNVVGSKEITDIVAQEVHNEQKFASQFRNLGSLRSGDWENVFMGPSIPEGITWGVRR